VYFSVSRTLFFSLFLPHAPAPTILPNVTSISCYEEAGLPAVEALMSGCSAAVFCYGQTGSGKTHTMYCYSRTIERNRHNKPAPNNLQTK
jgi:Cdc6-like AAA superfamily ATPase